MVVTLVLARLLLPRDFGLAGMVLVFGGLIQVFADLGFAPSLIQYKRITEDDRSTAFWTNTVVGVALTLVGIALAPFVARFFGEPSLEPLLIALSFSFTVAALGSTQAALLARQMRFRELEVAASIASLVGSALAITAALLGAGPWALIVQAVAIAVATTALVWVFAQWRPRLTFSGSSLRKLWGFGAGFFGSRVFGYLGRDSDNLLVGRFLGAHALGVYSMAYVVIAMPFDRLVAPIQSLLYPVFARLQDDLGRTREAWLQGMRMCLALIAPLSLGVAVIAHDFIAVVLGERWLPAEHVLQVLAYVACIQSATAMTTIVLASQFRTNLLLKVSTAAFGAHLACFVLGLHWGVLGVAVGYAISNTLVAVPLQVIAPARILRASARDVISATGGVVQATGAMALLVFGFRELLVAAGVGASVRLPVTIAIGVVVYAALIAWREPRLLDDFSVPARVRSGLALSRRRPVASIDGTAGL
jgi:polysaccharide transporter, PST family